MNTIRMKTEAEQAVTSLVAELFIRSRRSGTEGRESLEDVVAGLSNLLRELASNSQLAKSFVEQRLNTLRAKRRATPLQLSSSDAS